MRGGWRRRLMADGDERAEAVGRVVRRDGKTIVILPEGWTVEYALYRARREGTALILEPVLEGPRLASVSDRLRFEGGRWIVKGTHMPASALLELMSHGTAPARIMELCPYLSLEDIRACLALGAELTGGAGIRREEETARAAAP
jgi:uncharacterized protein (DUF433 family)